MAITCEMGLYNTYEIFSFLSAVKSNGCRKETHFCCFVQEALSREIKGLRIANGDNLC